MGRLRVWVVGSAAALVMASLAAAEPGPGVAWRQVVPAAAAVEGLDGSSWRTDLTVHNPNAFEVALDVELLPAVDAAAPLPGSRSLAVAPGATVVVGDVVGTMFPGHAAGALLLTSRAGADGGRPAVVVTSRTWTPVADGAGSFGQGIPAVPWPADGGLATPERRITGLPAAADFRVNVGVVNLDPAEARSYSLEVLDTAGQVVGATEVTLPARRWFQSNRLLERMGLAGDGHTVVVRRLGAAADGEFAAYASIVDRRTNDPSYRTAREAVEAWGRPRFVILPAAARTDGADGSVWTTDMAVHYPGDEPIVVLQMELIPSDPAGGGTAAPARAIERLMPGGTVAISDLLGSKFPAHELAALQLKVTTGGSRYENVQVGSRIWTPDPDGVGTMGQGIAALPYHEGDEPLVVAGLARSPEHRSNLGLVNGSANVRLALEVEVLDGAGARVGSFDETLEPWAHRQVDDVLGRVGAEGQGFTAVVRVTGSENLLLRPDEAWEPVLAAYGSVIDRRTNDPTFVDAVRVAATAGGGRGGWVDFDARAPWFRCPEEPFPDEAVVVRAFDRAWHFFGGGDDTRSIVQEVDFPAAGDWNQIGLRLELECPQSGLCDHWDRTGSLQLVLNPDDPAGEWRYLELMRHITPYRVGMCQYVDVTELAPLLRGRRTLSSWIDTWVGPGHAQGEGWRITWDFVFYPGEPRGADEVVNVWGRRSLEVGSTDPDRTVDAQLDPLTVTVPDGVARVEARLTTTGHAFGNTDNCAEFCPLRQDVIANGVRRSVLPWRTDCEYNPVAGQQGTWRYDRNGWCPGAIVPGHTVDLSDLVEPDGTLTVDLDVRTMDGEVFLNSTTAGTPPFEWISMQLLYFSE